MSILSLSKEYKDKLVKAGVVAGQSIENFAGTIWSKVNPATSGVSGSSYGKNNDDLPKMSETEIPL